MMRLRAAAPTGWLPQAWLALLVLAVSGFSFVFACAIPFAAFVVAATLTFAKHDALRVTVALWLANQLIGYFILGYPRTLNSFTWGVAIGLAAVLSLLVAQRIASNLRRGGEMVRAAGAFVGAFAVYEVPLYVLAVAGLGGASSFAVPIVGRIFAVNVIALVVLLGVFRGATVVARYRRPATAVTTPPQAISS